MRLLIRLFELRTELKTRLKELNFDLEGLIVTLIVRDEDNAMTKKLQMFVARHLEKHNSINIQCWNFSFLKISWSLIKRIYSKILLS
jgi:hypothetical protein